MKQVTFRSELGDQPDLAFVRALAGSSSVEKVKLVAINTHGELATMVLLVHGDRRFESELSDLSSVEAIDVGHLSEETSAFLLRCNPTGHFGQLHQLVNTHAVTLALPVIYHDMRVDWSIIGFDDDVKEFVRALPSRRDHEIFRIREFDFGREKIISSLTAKQHTVVETALEMGYYQSPRQTTHSDIADELDCSPSTITAHLQKAEKTVFRELFNTPGPS